jgi:transcriptional regulator with XRE-family HTH domain
MGDRKRTPTEAFGEVLKELRLKKGLTQEGLALDAETERSHISALERAEKGPSLGTILRLAQALGIPAGELVARVEHRLNDKKR